MSRLGRKEIVVKDGAKVNVDGRLVTVQGPKGSLSVAIDSDLELQLDNGVVRVINLGGKNLNAKFGLFRALISNMIHGVTQGYEQELEIVGVGYRVQLQGADLVFSLGFSHPVVVSPPEGTQFVVDGQTKLKVVGIDKQLVGQVASNIRALRSPDAYKGKGIRYGGELVKKKPGKRVKK